MSFEISGKLLKKFDVESKTASFQARDFVIETVDEKYPQMIKFQLTQDRCGIIDQYEEGKSIKVYFDLRGREWNGKYFTNLNAWKVENATSEVPAPQAPPSNESFPTEDPFANAASSEAKAEDFDDLPF